MYASVSSVYLYPRERLSFCFGQMCSCKNPDVKFKHLGVAFIRSDAGERYARMYSFNVNYKEDPNA